MKFKSMREYTHDEFVQLVSSLDEEELLDFSSKYGGYPVLFRMGLDENTLSGKSRRNSYPNGDIVYNNTSLFLANISLEDTSSLKGDSETKKLQFFSLDSLPNNLMDKDLIQVYLDFIKNDRIK